jgi:hypothetical protein
MRSTYTEETHVHVDRRAKEAAKVLPGYHVHLQRRVVESDHLFFRAREESNNSMQAHQLWTRDSYVDLESSRHLSRHEHTLSGHKEVAVSSLASTRGQK